MKRPIESTVRLSSGMTAFGCLLAVFTAVAVWDRPSLAADEFQDLVSQIPRSANAVVLLNMEKAYNSPLGVKENWRRQIEKAFDAGLIRVPPHAKRFVIASQIDSATKEPVWESAVIEFDEEISMRDVAMRFRGTLDKIEGLPALLMPNDTYLVQLGPATIGAMGPGERQAVLRWIRDIQKKPPPPLSPYLQKAAVYSDEAGSEIIMALDLEGVMSFERVGKYLKAHEQQVKEWNASLGPLTELLSNLRGIRIGVRIGEQPSGKIVADLHTDTTMAAPFAKPLMIQVLSDTGALINDLESWTGRASGSEISLAGNFSKSGLRELMSVVDVPVAEDTFSKAAAGKATAGGKATGAGKEPAATSPGELNEAEITRQYFKKVTGMFSDLKNDMGNLVTLAQSQLFYDKYARKIERLPMLNVDEEMLDYGTFVANALRQATSSVKTMGIQSGVRQASVSTSDYSGSGYSGYGYGSFGWYGRGDPYADVKAAGNQKRIIRSEEKAVMATKTQQIREQVIAATNDIRRKMTKKYQIEF